MAQTKITTTTETLSRAADALLARRDRLSKNAILNSLATAIAGPGHDWGFLKNAPEGHFIQNGIDAPGEPAAKETVSEKLTVYLVLFDEREDWAQAPDVIFFSREDALAHIKNSGFFTGEDASKALKRLLTEDHVTMPMDAEEYEACEEPASITIQTIEIDFPSSSFIAALRGAFLSGYSCGMDHDQGGDGFVAESERAWDEERETLIGAHARQKAVSHHG